MTAETVMALLPGLRCRLLRAMAPSRAKMSSIMSPNAFASGFTIAGATMVTPTRNRTAPSPTMPDDWEISVRTAMTMSANPIHARRPTLRS